MPERGGQAGKLRLAAARRQGRAGQPDALAAAVEQHRHRERQQPRAVRLLRQGCLGGEAHRGRAVDPHHDALRDLPFALAHELRVAPGRAAPVHVPPLVTGLQRAVLPEIVAHPGPAAAVLAQQHRAGKVFGPRQQRRQAGGLGLGAGAQRGGGG